MTLDGGGFKPTPNRVPREGGDPDPYTPPDRPWNILVLRQALDEDECEVDGSSTPTRRVPRAGEDQWVASRLRKKVWIPAFAGKTGEGARSLSSEFPAKARFQRATSRLHVSFWVPACAGKTEENCG